MSGSDHYFFRLGSGLSHTNLQVFSLWKASETWRDILEGKYGEQVQVPCAYVVTMMGTSVAQLLGQNPVKPKRAWVDDPQKLFDAFADEHDFEQGLRDDFAWFMGYYDAVRHFGVDEDGSRHRTVKGLSRDVTARCYAIGRRVWEEVLDTHGQKLGAKIADLDLDELWLLAEAEYADEDPGRDAGVDE